MESNLFKYGRYKESLLEKLENIMENARSYLILLVIFFIGIILGVIFAILTIILGIVFMLIK